MIESDDASPRTFLLALLHAFACDVPVQLLIRAASLFDIDENRTRVALHRLRSKGLIDSVDRGTYRVTGSTAVLSEVDGWRNVLRRLRPWDGSWLGVHTAPLPRADKTVARRRDRATDIVGLRELAPGLLVRPDNLTGGVEELRRRLLSLGIEPEAVVFRLDALGTHEAVARGLWSGLALDQRYRTHIERLDATTVRIAGLPVDEAARESFVVGSRAIHDIVLDPLLPEPLVDPDLRERFVRRMSEFDDFGREAWRRALGSELTLRRAPTVHPG
ncbi:MAG: PaaX family transcriptional regulator [Myxococcota bacterium]